MPRAEDRLEVAQFIPNLVPHDAVGNHTVLTARALSDAGVRNRIYADSARPVPGVSYHDFRDYRPESGRTLILYQASTGAPEMVTALLVRSERLTLCYHNITPGHFFAPYDAVAARALDHARAELRMLAGRTRVAMADSEFNAAELRALGVADVRVIPPFSGLLALDPDLEPTAPRRVPSEPELLFVGRLVPSKGIGALLRVMALLRVVAPEVRLSIVGAPGPWSFMQELDRLCSRLQLDNVRFLGSTNDAGLRACYQRASAFITLSEHEGFCLPIVEAMARGVPVIARDAGASAETLGGAGVVVRGADPPIVAEIVLEVLRNQGLRESLVSLGVERARQIEGFPRAEAILEAVRAASGA